MIKFFFLKKMEFLLRKPSLRDDIENGELFLCLVMSQHHLCCLNHCGIRHPPKHQSRHYLAKLKTAETAAANFPFTCHFLLLKIMIGICDRKCKLLLSKQKTSIELMISDIVVFVLSQMSMTFYQIIQK